MGLLDEAIREHLELKRRRGADAGDIARAEQEALGPARRGPAPLELPPEESPDAAGEEGLADDLGPEQLAAPVDEVGFGDPEEMLPETAHAEDEFEEYDPSAAPLPLDTGHLDPGLHEPAGPEASLPHPHIEAPPHDPEDLADPPPDPAHPPGPVEEHITPERGLHETAGLDPDHLSAQTQPFSAVDPAGPTSHTGQTAPEVQPQPFPSEGQPAPSRTSGYPDDVSPDLPEAAPPEHSEGAPPDHHEAAPSDHHQAAPPEHSEAVPPAHPDDVLEETPEFLQETPEHDRLWFEQRPPRDFDFDK